MKGELQRRWREERHVQVPARFEYEVAGSVGEAVELLERYGEGARLIAGGHSLIPMMKLRLAAPEVVVDISGLDSELRYIEDDGGRPRQCGPGRGSSGYLRRPRQRGRGPGYQRWAYRAHRRSVRRPLRDL